MPLRCIDPTNDNRGVHCFDLTDAEWKALEARNRRERHLRMPCCDAEVVFRRPRSRIKHFAHKARPRGCLGGPETEHHIYLKMLAVERARLTGWEANTEVRGKTPKGEPWIADVLATRKGERALAIEIQWSRQTRDETRRRSRRYDDSRVRGIWLMRRVHPDASQDIHATVFGISEEEQFAEGIPYSPSPRPKEVWPWRYTVRGPRKMSVESFLDAVFEDRIKYGLPNYAGDPEGWHVTTKG
ncbi:MAG: competence protein CoiA family protein [Gammaproteobacteria bacterium]|nr:competence protein CoiA family protein [Gammaproteobacteria bacterium]